MKFNKHNLPKSRAELETFVRQNGLRAHGVVKHKERNIFIAETDLERKPGYDWGFFQTAWFINTPESEDKFEGGSWVEFDAMHDSDKGWTVETKRQARIATAIAQAEDFIDKLIEVGRIE